MYLIVKPSFLKSVASRPESWFINYLLPSVNTYLETCNSRIIFFSFFKADEATNSSFVNAINILWVVVF